MARIERSTIAVLIATTLFTASTVLAAEPTPVQQKAAPQETAVQETAVQETAVEKDFGRVSTDGAGAFQDIVRARLAIFDGRVADAKKYVNAADNALGKAKTDDTVFTKAEVDLKPPAAVPAPALASKNGDGAPPAVDKTADQTKTPIAWLPVDGVVAINEDYSADPTKSAAVADANKSLKSGDRKGALTKLKLAGMDVDVTLAVIPLEKTIGYAHQATALIKDGKYYEASQILRQAEDSERFDAADVSATPETPIKTSAN